MQKIIINCNITIFIICIKNIKGLIIKEGGVTLTLKSLFEPRKGLRVEKYRIENANDPLIYS